MDHEATECQHEQPKGQGHQVRVQVRKEKGKEWEFIDRERDDARGSVPIIKGKPRVTWLPDDAQSVEDTRHATEKAGGLPGATGGQQLLEILPCT